MKYLISLCAVFLVATLAYAQNVDYSFNPNLSPIKYGIGSFTENGHGNHRVVVNVSAPSDAVLARVEWRRRDVKPEDKGIIVENPNGKIVNSKAFNVKDLDGDVVFEAKTAGNYYIYYLPYTPSSAPFIEKSDYYSPVSKADANWLLNNKIDKDTVGESILNSFSKAKQIEVQARDAFNSMYPMEVPVTDKELAKLNKNFESSPFLVFAEDRLFQIRMLNTVPYKWYKSGEVLDFKGKANPNEIYTFQIGLYANKQDLKNVKLKISDLKGAKTIPSSEIHCINAGGVDYLGKPFTKEINVKSGAVQPLWFYVRMPKDAKGDFTGKIGIEAENLPVRTVNIDINVSGDVIADGGVSDLWRMSRISWLDSTLAINDDLVKPYTPVKVSGSKASILNRTIEFNSLGFPKQVTSNKQKILNSQFDFGVFTNGNKVDFKNISKKTIVKDKGAYEFENLSSSSDLDLKVVGRLEFDGVLEYKVKLTAKKDVNLSDVKLDVPMNKSVAKYIIGLGVVGGNAPISWDWQWNTARIDYMVWLGDYNAGMQIQLKPEDEVYRVAGFIPDDKMPKGWWNNNNGGINLRKTDKDYMINVYGGEKSLKAGESADYNFRVTVTPFKPLDNRHYSYRLGGPGSPETNQLHLHHASGENPYINYPFIKINELKNLVKNIKNVPIKVPFNFSYLTGDKLTSKEGSVTAWVESTYDWATTTENQELISVDFDKNQVMGVYWNRDTKSLRVVSYGGGSSNPTFHVIADTSVAPGSVKVGEKHLVTLSWGKSIKVFWDGALVLDYPFNGAVGIEANSIKVNLNSGYAYSGVRIDNKEATSQNADKNKDDNTIVFSTFKEKKNQEVASEVGVSGVLVGDSSLKGNTLYPLTSTKTKSWDLNIYYTCRELSNHVYEIWALRSLGDEVYDNKGFVYTADGAKIVSETGGGYQWLNEHLQNGYIPAWHCNLGEDHCAAIATKFVSRWMNYYVNGMDFLMKETGLNGLYLDGIGYDRETMKRIARVMESNDPNYRINYHSGDNYHYLDSRSNVLSTTLEHIPYVSHLWIGEMFDYVNTPPDYWFIEMSGIPFGVRNEMLNYENGGNPYRGMLYAMTSRQAPSYIPMLRFWDAMKIEKRTMVGYWDKKPLATTNNPNILSTVYKMKDSVLIAVGSWGKDASINIKLDYKACGIDPNKSIIIAHKIDNFQDEKVFTSLDNIFIPASKGIILEVKNVK